MFLTALLVAGAAGGAVVSLLDRHRSAIATPVPPSAAEAPVGAVPMVSVGGSAEGAAAIIAPSVVTLEVAGGASADTGSGVVIRADGYILTNNHVVAAAETGGTVNVTLSDGGTLRAAIVGHDATSDLAVVKVVPGGLLRAATFADSEQLRIGQAVLAVGAPLGLANTVTSGIVSSVHRAVATGEAGAGAQAVLDAVQTDAAINPGNSGGALVDLAGRVVGINSAIATVGATTGATVAGSIGVGFAIDSNQAQQVARELIATGHATHSQLGLNVADAVGETVGAPGLGATVRDLASGGPAATSGLQTGDVVIRVGGRLVTDANSLMVAVRAHQPGAVITLSYLRRGSARSVQIVLGGVSSD